MPLSLGFPAHQEGRLMRSLHRKLPPDDESIKITAKILSVLEYFGQESTDTWHLVPRGVHGPTVWQDDCAPSR